MADDAGRITALERMIRGDNGQGLSTRVTVLEGRTGDAVVRLDCIEKEVKIVEEETLRNTVFREQMQDRERQFNRAKLAFWAAALLQIVTVVITWLR